LIARIQMERDERSKNRVSVKQEDLQFTEIKDINRNSKDESINPNLNRNYLIRKNSNKLFQLKSTISNQKTN
jgi:hypothetical protein